MLYVRFVVPIRLGLGSKAQGTGLWRVDSVDKASSSKVRVGFYDVPTPCAKAHGFRKLGSLTEFLQTQMPQRFMEVSVYTGLLRAP